jgi:alkylation response protein AidB-like acyl-CoA dehydrogenase
VLDDEGLPAWRTAFLPADTVEVLDTWDTIGLRGTASNDYRCAPVVVADEHLFDVFGETLRDEPLYRLPWWFIVKITPVCTAIARHSIDEAIAIADGKVLLPELTTLLERPGTAGTIARAEGRLRSARAFALDEIGRVWDACLSAGDLSRAATVGLRLAMAQAAHDSLAVTRDMVDLVTTGAIASDSALARLHADATVAATHLAHNHRTWETLGRRMLDLPLGRTPYI